MSVQSFASSFIPKFIYIKRIFKNKPFRLLDIGAGNHSATKTKRVFPQVEYHGVDIKRNYNNSREDFNVMAGFYEMDLTKLDFSAIPDNYFDVIVMAHVIEHLHNGDEVITGLLPKLQNKGYMYIEYPGEKSTRLPSMYGTLNFKDDPTHVRIYSVKELSQLLIKNGCSIIKAGVRKNGWFIAAMPFRIIGKWTQGKKLQGNIFWDILGFAEFVWMKKEANN